MINVQEISESITNSLNEFDETMNKIYNKYFGEETKTVDETVQAEEVKESVENQEEEATIKPFDLDIKVDENGNVIENSVTVENTEGQTSDLITPFTFEAELDENGNVINETKAPSEEETSTVIEEETEDNVIANFSTTGKEQQKEEIENVMKNQPMQYADNSKILAAYPHLKAIETAVREIEGYDITFVQRVDKIIAGCITFNGIPMPEVSIMIDLDSIIIGKERKWFNTFIDISTNSECLEIAGNFNVNNTELLKKHILKTATKEDYEAGIIYNSKYLAVNGIIDLETMPSIISDGVKTQIIERLYGAIAAGVFNEFRGTTIDVFKFDKYVSPDNYLLRSGDIVVTVKKDCMVVDTKNN